MTFGPEDYEEDVLEKLNVFFEQAGEIVSESTLEELSIIIYEAINQ